MINSNVFFFLFVFFVIVWWLEKMIKAKDKCVSLEKIKKQTNKKTITYTHELNTHIY